MGKPYSLDLRERIVGYVEEGHSARAAAGVFGVSPSTAVRLATAQRDHGSVAPKPKGRASGTAGKLTAHIAFLLARMKSEPDTTLQELAGVLREDRGVEVQLSSIYRALIRAGYAGDEMTAHGFRATASSLLNESGEWHPDAIERQLAHVESDDVRRAYARAEFWDERVRMMQWWADYLDGLKAGLEIYDPPLAQGTQRVLPS